MDSFKSMTLVFCFPLGQYFSNSGVRCQGGMGGGISVPGGHDRK